MDHEYLGALVWPSVVDFWDVLVRLPSTEAAHLSVPGQQSTKASVSAPATLQSSVSRPGLQLQWNMGFESL